MATINNKAGIRDTFKVRPDLKEVFVLENGDHYFTKALATEAAGEKGKVTTLKADAKELEDEAPKA